MKTYRIFFGVNDTHDAILLLIGVAGMLCALYQLIMLAHAGMKSRGKRNARGEYTVTVRSMDKRNGTLTPFKMEVE